MEVILVINNVHYHLGIFNNVGRLVNRLNNVNLNQMARRTGPSFVGPKLYLILDVDDDGYDADDENDD